jgi:hypothetical protein
MKKRKRFSVILVFLMLFTVLSVFAGSNSFSVPLGSGYWGGSVSVSSTEANANTYLDPLPPTTNVYAGVSLGVYVLNQSGILHYSYIGAYEDYITYVGINGYASQGYTCYSSHSSHRGYINGNEAFQDLNAY